MTIFKKLRRLVIYSETQITPEYAYMFDFKFEVSGFSDDLNLKESGFIDV
jgi:hypothetical protein